MISTNLSKSGSVSMSFQYPIYPAPSSDFKPGLVDRCKRLRLKGLKEEPQCFSSTYDDELQFSTAQWEARLSNKSACTFAVIHSDHEPVSPFSNTSFDYLSENDWVGTVALIRITPDESLSGPRSRDTCLAFGIGGMYVHSEHRRRGIGAMLLRACENRAAQQASHYGCSRYLIELEVQGSNRDAIALYGRCGYSLRARDDHTADLAWHVESEASTDNMNSKATIMLEKGGAAKVNACGEPVERLVSKK